MNPRMPGAAKAAAVACCDLAPQICNQRWIQAATGGFALGKYLQLARCTVSKYSAGQIHSCFARLVYKQDGTISPKWGCQAVHQRCSQSSGPIGPRLQRPTTVDCWPSALRSWQPAVLECQGCARSDLFCVCYWPKLWGCQQGGLPPGS